MPRIVGAGKARTPIGRRGLARLRDATLTMSVDDYYSCHFAPLRLPALLRYVLGLEARQCIYGVQFTLCAPFLTLSQDVTTTTSMSGIAPSPRFFQQPVRYLKWASINKPAYFYSIVVGCAGPIMLLTVLPIRRYLGAEPRPKIPLTYPGRSILSRMSLEAIPRKVMHDVQCL